MRQINQISCTTVRPAFEGLDGLSRYAELKLDAQRIEKALRVFAGKSAWDGKAVGVRKVRFTDGRCIYELHAIDSETDPRFPVVLDKRTTKALVNGYQPVLAPGDAWTYATLWSERCSAASDEEGLVDTEVHDGPVCTDNTPRPVAIDEEGDDWERYSAAPTTRYQPPVDDYIPWLD